VKMNRPGISTGLLTDAGVMCDGFSKQIATYSKGNTAVLESLTTEAETRTQAVVSVCVAERAKADDKKKESAPLRKRYDTIYELPNEPATGKQLYGLPCVWQGHDHNPPPESDLIKITGRLNWAFARSTIDGVGFPVTRFYIVWEIPLAGSEMSTAYEPVVKKDKPSGADFINEFQTFFHSFNAKS
jgi:hypothetical protein